MHFGPCHVTFELRQELQDHKIGIFVKKRASQRLKKSKKFAFRNSPFTRPHNVSLKGTQSIRY